PVVETAVGEPLGLGYGALRRRELATEEDKRYSMFEVGQGTGYAPELERLERVSAFRQPTLTIWADLEDGTIYIDVPTYPPPAPPDHTQRLDVMPPTLFTEIDRDVRELYTRSGAVRDEIFSQRYQLRSLEQEQKRAIMTFGAL
ncbi:hypothetical protein Tco_0220970, partial [Tanacetum coccineum]